MCYVHTQQFDGRFVHKDSASRHRDIIKFMSESLLLRFQLQQKEKKRRKKKKKLKLALSMFKNHKSKANIGLVPKRTRVDFQEAQKLNCTAEQN